MLHKLYCTKFQECGKTSFKDGCTYRPWISSEKNIDVSCGINDGRGIIFADEKRLVFYLLGKENQK